MGISLSKSGEHIKKGMPKKSLERYSLKGPIPAEDRNENLDEKWMVKYCFNFVYNEVLCQEDQKFNLITPPPSASDSASQASASHKKPVLPGEEAPHVCQTNLALKIFL